MRTRTQVTASGNEAAIIGSPRTVPVTEPFADPSLLSSPLQVPWVDSQGERPSLDLEELELLIGRSHRCRFRDPGDPVISRQQPRLVCTNGVWHVVDSGSRNRTCRNGHEVIAPEAIASGNTISVGQCRVIVGPPGAGGAGEVSEPSSTEHTIRTLDISGEHSSGTMRVLVEAARRIASQEPANRVIESLLALHSTGAERGLVALHRADGTGAPTLRSRHRRAPPRSSRRPHPTSSARRRDRPGSAVPARGRS